MPRTVRYPHKFRFQVLHRWLIDAYPPSPALDIGGGKGLLSYLLNQSGWQCIVIDPHPQILDWKYKDIQQDKQVKLALPQRSSVPHTNSAFSDIVMQLPKYQNPLLIGLHAHGCNMAIVNAAKAHNLDFVLLPCCVIDEPIAKVPGINWLKSLVEYAHSLDLHPRTTTLPFVGQSTLIYTQNHLIK